MISFDLRNSMNKEPIHLRSEYDCPAITRCCDAWYQALQSAEDRGVNKVSKWLRANEAYRNAMPPLNSPENIRDFLACLTHCTIINAISNIQCDQLLKMARLALTAMKDMSRTANEPAEEAARGGKRAIERPIRVVKQVANTECCEPTPAELAGGRAGS